MQKILGLLVGHEAQVHSVRWIGSNNKFLISSSADKKCFIWRFNDINDYGIEYKLIGHNSSVIVADCIQLDEKQFVSASSSTDKTVRIWKNEEQIEMIKVENFVFDVKLVHNKMFPRLMIILTGADEMINLYELREDNRAECLIKLSGHQDWIRSIDIHFSDGTNFIYL